MKHLIGRLWSNWKCWLARPSRAVIAEQRRVHEAFESAQISAQQTQKIKDIQTEKELIKPVK